ncbi:MAG: hypothetical protein B7C24_05835 [Bacteroidetes bacterium 4572_77]|nr:MAG: hypothetical protein B7C24_05835 [Bacteroidetes bacterium 4572_77]
MKKAEVNIAQSQKIGQIVRDLVFKPTFLYRPFLSISIIASLKASMYYYAVGICHQTYNLTNSKLSLFGWDFLEYGFIEIAQQKPELLDKNHLLSLSTTKLIEEIKPFFSEDHKASNCTLDRLEERATLWLEMATLLQELETTAYDLAKNNTITSFYNKLAGTLAYSDPLQKKSSFFMKLLEDANLHSYGESAEITPIMDYHMQRVLLRTGCVEIIDKETKNILQKRIEINDDSEIRKACIESMKIIAQTSSYSVLKMNDVFYTLGRSCCLENLLCQGHSCEKTPCTLSLAVELGEHKECIFQKVCKGAHNLDYQKYWQPMVDTHYY